MSVAITTLDKYAKVGISTLLNDLMAYWKLDEHEENPSWTVYDSTENNYDGVAGNIVFSSSGKINGCYGFTGISSGVIIGNVIKPTTAISISFWFKNTSNGSEQYFIDHVEYEGAWKGYGITIYDSGSLGIFMADGNPSHLLDVAYSYAKNDGNWHHVVVTFNGSIVYVYLDSVKSSGWSWPYTLAYLSTGDNLLLGTNTGGSLKLNGSMDEVGIWDRALTDSEVAELYNSGNGLTYPF